MNNEKQNERTENDQKRAVAKESEKREGAASKGMLKRIGIYALVAIGIFFLGLIPMWFIARDRAEQLGATQRELRVARMQNLLASAAIDARRGEYEPARQAASDFFTVARTEIDRNDSALNTAQRSGLESLLAQRDESITLLARSDPAAADRLSELYAGYRKVLGNPSSQ
ncbi:MAG TPA: hypothetical protein VFZ40_01275 [Pyrinomonadaceae bacterium]